MNQRVIHLYTNIIDAVKKLVDTMAETDGESEAIHLCATIIDAVKILVDEMGDTEGESGGDPLVHHHY